MKYKELRDLVEKKKAARRALARKQRKQAVALTNPSTQLTEKPSIESETKVEDVVVETKATEVVETPVTEVVETPVTEVVDAGENIPADESAEGASVVEEVLVEETSKKKARKKRRTSEVDDGVAG